MQNLEIYFEQFGLSNIETKLYITLLGRGPSTVLELAKQTKINRTTTHINIEGLIKKGLVTYIKKGARRSIIAEPPERFSNILENDKLKIKSKENSLNEMIQNIYDTVSHVKENTQSEVKYYEGKVAVGRIYDEILKSEEVRTYGSYTKITETFPENIEKFVQAFKRGVKIWDLFEYSGLNKNVFIELSKQFKNYKLKIFPKDIILHSMDYLIYSNSIAIIQSQDEPSAIVINNKFLSNNSKIIYDLLWRFLPDSFEK